MCNNVKTSSTLFYFDVGEKLLFDIDEMLFQHFIDSFQGESGVQLIFRMVVLLYFYHKKVLRVNRLVKQ